MQNEPKNAALYYRIGTASNVLAQRFVDQGLLLVSVSRI